MVTARYAVKLESAASALDPQSNRQWVHLFSSGVMHARDGRTFRLDDAQEVISQTLQRAGEMELPIDYDHQTDFTHLNGKPAPAAGWIKNLKVHENGIWSEVEWADKAANMLHRKEYRYISPTFTTDQTGRVLHILRAALTNNPALELTQLANSEDKIMNQNADFKTHVANLLGIDPTTAENTVLEALKTEMTRKAIDSEEITAVTTLAEALHKERNQTQITRARHKVSEAITSGAMPPSMRGWLTRLCTQNEAAFDEFIAKIGTPFEYLFKEQITEKHIAELNGNTVENSSDKVIAEQLGIDPKEMSS